jgi:hypothetical protein
MIVVLVVCRVGEVVVERRVTMTRGPAQPLEMYYAAVVVYLT